MTDDTQRLNALERSFERIDERLGGKLGQPDAVKLMESAAAGDAALRKDFIERFGDFRVEVREAFKHNERQTSADIFRAVTESEARIMAAINGLSPAERRGLHPVVTYGGGGAGVAAVIAFLINVITNGHFGMPG